MRFSSNFIIDIFFNVLLKALIIMKIILDKKAVSL